MEWQFCSFISLRFVSIIIIPFTLIALPVSLDATGSNSSSKREWSFTYVFFPVRYAHCWWNVSSALRCIRFPQPNRIQQRKKKYEKDCFMFSIHNSHFCRWIVQNKHLNLVVKHHVPATNRDADLLSYIQIFFYRSNTSGICSWFHCFCNQFIFFLLTV